jgi:DNA-binding CsgD family transcriptional regulator
VGLFTPDRRYLGFLGLLTDSKTPPSDAVRSAIQVLSPLVAMSVDPLRSIAAAAYLVQDAAAGILVTRTGLMPLPGMPAHRLLSPGSSTVAAALELLATSAHACFLSPASGGAEGGDAKGYVCVTALRVVPEDPFNVHAVLVISPAGNLHGLTPRELEILGRVVEGWSNRRIAAAFFVAERTVATHMEHILAKLEAPGRALVAVQAHRQCLYLPDLLRCGPT